MVQNGRGRSSGAVEAPTDGAVRVRATRRSSEEVRSLLVKAAGELFGENGYSGVTTRQIAERAGVSEAILWRQFRTKAALFNVAVTEPIVQFLSDFVQQFRTYAESIDGTEPLLPPEYGADVFFGGLYDVFREEKSLIMTLLAARAFDPQILEAHGAGAGTAPLGEIYNMVSDFSGGILEQHGIKVDINMVVRLSIGMILAAAVLDELVFPDGPKKSRDQVVDEMVRLVFHGIVHQGDVPRAGKAARKPRTK
jgi:AcrR family transcriptional regulator